MALFHKQYVLYVVLIEIIGYPHLWWCVVLADGTFTRTHMVEV